MKNETSVETCSHQFGLNVSVWEYYLINDVGKYCPLQEMTLLVNGLELYMKANQAFHWELATCISLPQFLLYFLPSVSSHDSLHDGHSSGGHVSQIILTTLALLGSVFSQQCKEPSTFCTSEKWHFLQQYLTEFLKTN